MEESAVLQTAFNAFTRGGPTMDGRTFVKLCKDCKLVDKVVTTIDIDLIFAKVKEKGQRTISFSGNLTLTMYTQFSCNTSPATSMPRSFPTIASPSQKTEHELCTLSSDVTPVTPRQCEDYFLLNSSMPFVNCGAAFERSLKLIAEKKKLPLFKIVEQVQSAKGPQFVGTTADAVRFHDDKSTYTGVYANGGPSTVDTAKSRGADLTKRPANVRGVKK
eukprot:GHVT01063833.1.p1 GENE.GHVT01063833.1~~GHVT01063833.1.p1  ORF type:complete len:218 (-),score=15.09 GHVT01063833.1:670-1323(-)